MTTATPNGSRTFFDLPGEVRNLIYKELRDHAIFRASKSARREGPPSLARIKIGYESAEWLYPLPPYSTATEAIQNVRISVRTSENLNQVENFGLIEYFGGSDITRESCQITLDLTNHPVSVASQSNKTLFRALRTLVGFKMVMVTLFEMYIGSWDDFCPAASEAQRIREELERVLGPAVYSDDMSRCVLQFYPKSASDRGDGR